MERRDFELPAPDQQLLDSCGLSWEAISDGSQWVLVRDFLLPEGYAQKTVTVAIRVEVGYPRTPLDMVFFNPAITRNDGRPIGATSVSQRVNGEVFQRWSRHRTKENPWNPATDNLESHMILVEDWLDREFE